MSRNLLCVLMLAVFIAAAGCASTPMSQRHSAMIPVDARIVAQGKPTISFMITHPGIIHIYDDTTGALINSMDLTNIPNLNTSLLVIDKAKAAVIFRNPSGNGDTKLMSPIDTSHQYTIWFQPGGASNAAHRAQPTTSPAKALH